MESSRNAAEQLKKKGLTQETLGKLAGTTGRYINCLDHGKSGGIVVWARVAAALEQLYQK